jgi:type I restriction enzyme S subunit
MITLAPDTSYPITGIYSFGRGLIKRTPILGSETAYERMARLKSNQVVMSKLNAWEGALAVVDDEFDGTYVSPEYPTFSINRQVADPSYIKHLMAWPEFWTSLTPRGSMVRRKRTTPATFLDAMVPLPDLAEQHRIAHKLDTSLGAISQITALRTKSSTLGESHLDAVLRQVKTRAPLSAALRPVNNFTDLEPDSTYPITGIYSFGRGLIKRPVILGSDTAYTRMARLQSGQVVMSKLNAWEGALAVVDDKFDGTYVSPEYPVFAIDHNVADPAYVEHLLRWQGLWSLLTPRGSMVRRKRTTPTTFLATEVPFPSLAEQRRIARQLTLVHRAGAAANEQTSQLAALRPALLNAAFSGQL